MLTLVSLILGTLSFAAQFRHCTTQGNDVVFELTLESITGDFVWYITSNGKTDYVTCAEANENEGIRNEDGGCAYNLNLCITTNRRDLKCKREGFTVAYGRILKPSHDAFVNLSNESFIKGQKSDPIRSTIFTPNPILLVLKNMNKTDNVYIYGELFHSPYNPNQFGQSAWFPMDVFFQKLKYSGPLNQATESDLPALASHESSSTSMLSIRTKFRCPNNYFGCNCERRCDADKSHECDGLGFKICREDYYPKYDNSHRNQALFCIRECRSIEMLQSCYLDGTAHCLRDGYVPNDFNICGENRSN